MPSLRQDPPLFDLAAWRVRLEELRAEPESKLRDDQIWYAQGRIAALEAAPEKTPAEGP
jgi:hypothetical protein